MRSVCEPQPGVAVAQASPANLALNEKTVAKKKEFQPPDAVILNLHRLMLSRPLTLRVGVGRDEMAGMGFECRLSAMSFGGWIAEVKNRVMSLNRVRFGRI